MAVFALTDAFAYVGGHDFTTDSNRLQATMDAAALDSTTFGGDGWTQLVGGLKSVTFDMAGLWQSAASDAVDPDAFAGLGASRVITFGPEDVEGSTAYIWQALTTTYSLGGSVGDVAPFTLAASGSSGEGVVRGRLTKARGTVSAVGATGTALNLGAVSAAQYVYVTAHVFSAGTTATILLESDDNSGFTTPTTRATIGPLTARGGTWVTRVAGPITDTFWRLNVSAITGSFVIAAAIGIQ